MAKLPGELTETIWLLKRELLGLIEDSTATEFTLFSLVGETQDTLPFLDELKNVSERAKTWFSRLSNSQIRIADSQPNISPDMLKLVIQSVEQIQAEIPAMKRSIEEVQQEWSLP